MQESFEKVLRQARWRYAVNMLVELVVGSVLVVAMLVEKLLAVPVITQDRRLICPARGRWQWGRCVTGLWGWVECW